jgi:hypothetical protein
MTDTKKKIKKKTYIIVKSIHSSLHSESKIIYKHLNFILKFTRQVLLEKKAKHTISYYYKTDKWTLKN